MEFGYIKKSFVYIGFWIASVNPLQAQDSTSPDTLNNIYDHGEIDVQPKFEGGRKALGKYIDGRKNHHYPKEARENKIEGKVVIQFIIHEDGTTGDFEVVEGIGYGCDEAALEAFKKMPRWKPGMLNGAPVKVRTRMAYLYKL